MATRLSSHFRQRRQALGLRPSAVARLLGYKNVPGAANKLVRFEETGRIHPDLLSKIAALLEISQATIDRLIEDDHREHLHAWTKWADEPIQPFLLVSPIPGAFVEYDLPDEIGTESLEQFAANLAKTNQQPAVLVVSRRRSVVFTEGGERIEVHEEPPAPRRTVYRYHRGHEVPTVRPLDEPTAPLIEHDRRQ